MDSPHFLPFWLQAFATEVEQLGDSEASELLISGQLIRVKGWWRKGARALDAIGL